MSETTTTETPLCDVHQRLEDANALECEIAENNCVACSLNERVQLLNILAPFAAQDGSEDSLTVLQRLADFANTHQGEGRVVVSYPAPQPALHADVTFQCDARGKQISEEDRRGGIRAGGEGTFYPECCGEKPAVDAGEWRVDPKADLIVLNQEDEQVANTWSAEYTRQIVADHRSAAAVPVLIFALESFLFAPSGQPICACENVNAVKAGMGAPCAYCNARRAIAEALTTVNQTGGER